METCPLCEPSDLSLLLTLLLDAFLVNPGLPGWGVSAGGSSLSVLEGKERDEIYQRRGGLRESRRMQNGPFVKGVGWILPALTTVAAHKRVQGTGGGGLGSRKKCGELTLVLNISQVLCLFALAILTCIAQVPLQAPLARSVCMYRRWGVRGSESLFASSGRTLPCCMGRTVVACEVCRLAVIACSCCFLALPRRRCCCCKIATLLVCGFVLDLDWDGSSRRRRRRQRPRRSSSTSRMLRRSASSVDTAAAQRDGQQ